MGDRAYCTLRLVGAIDRAAYDALVESFGHNEESESDLGWFAYEEVTDARPVEDHDAIIAAGLTLFWWNDAGLEYGEEILIRTPDEEVTLMTYKGEIVVSASATAEELEEARRWQKFREDAKLVITERPMTGILPLLTEEQKAAVLDHSEPENLGAPADPAISTYVPAPGHEGKLPADLTTAHVRHNDEVWTDSAYLCTCDSFEVAKAVAEALRAKTPEGKA